MSNIRLSVRQLVEFLMRTGSIDSRFTGFDRANEGARIHRKLQKNAGDGYRAEVFLRSEQRLEDIDFTIEGRADGIFVNECGLTVIDEIKTTAVPYEDIQEEMNPCHWAQGMVYGAIYAQQQALDALGIQLTYYQIDTDQVKRFCKQYSSAELVSFFLKLLQEYLPWARLQSEWKIQRDQSLASLPFPFAEYRPGQRALAGEIYRTCVAGKTDEHKGGTRLFCQAPTGIGKTMSAIFPALRAIGTQNGEKLFYFTARNTTQSAAEDAIARLRLSAPKLCLRSITLTAKEKVCLHPDSEGHPACLPEVCPYANGYYDRLKNALRSLLDSSGSFDRPALTNAAQQHTVCPFELALDLSSWCDVIIGDYNYLFDPVVHLKRFFDSPGEWLFLLDEAHNLPDRTRAMYSASFSKSCLTDAKRALGKGKSSLKTALIKADKALLAARRTCAKLFPSKYQQGLPVDDSVQQTSLLEEAPSLDLSLPEPLFVQDGTLFFQDPPENVLSPLRALIVPLQDWLEANPDEAAHPKLLELYFSVQDLIRTADRYDDHFITQMTVHHSDLLLSLLCLDPSSFVNTSLSMGRCSALFSATLTPPGYYRSVLGCTDARAVALESPFPQEHLGLYCLSSVSTRYRDRESSIATVSDALATLMCSKTGNYLAFFPSYAYLKQVHENFTARYHNLATIVQQSNTTEDERKSFLAQFKQQPSSSLMGFAVMGGIFGEGIDLAGDRLIGCAIVGVGLPQVSPKQEMLRYYYDKHGGNGFDYAYRFPGMNKVLQAAGRVIRTPEDKGVVLLLDDRFAQPEYARLFPPNWRHLQYLSSTAELKNQLSTFWHI